MKLSYRFIPVHHAFLFSSHYELQGFPGGIYDNHPERLKALKKIKKGGPLRPGAVFDVAPSADIVTQPYGCVDNSLEWAVGGSCGFFHAGIDLGSSNGGWSIYRTPIVATRMGTVVAVGMTYLGPNAVTIKYDDGMFVEHGHMDENWVQVGQRVNPGDVIGLLGTRGSSTAPHLHVEARVDGATQGVSGAPNNDPTRDPGSYLNGIGSTCAPGQFSGVVDADGGAHVRVLPGTDQPIVQQPGANPNVVDKGITLCFKAWCHHPPAIPDSITGQPDDRWFQTVSGNWMASATINGNPPSDMNPVVDPTQPVPQPPPVFTPKPLTLKGFGIWEWNDQTDYQLVYNSGFTHVLIRASNGDGSGAAHQFESQWRTRSALAKAAGLIPVAWTYWYGPSEGVTGDVATYLAGCANYTASLGFDTPFWVIDVEDRNLDKLDSAIAILGSKTNLPVVVAPPGDPNEYGIKWDWQSLDKVVSGYMPQVYTSPGAWNGSPNPKGATDAYQGFKDAIGEWSKVPALYPVNNETDIVRISDWKRAAKETGTDGFISYWRWLTAPLTHEFEVFEAYTGVAISPTPTPKPVPIPPTPHPIPDYPPTPPPTPTPTPTPVPQPHPTKSWIEVVLEFIRRLFGGK